MYALIDSAEGDYYLSVPPDPGIAAAALGASASAAPGAGESAAPGTSESALSVLAHSSTVLPCPAAPSGLLSGLHLPSFSTNLVSGADLLDAWVDQFAPGGQRVTHCTCSRTGRHLATFTHRPGSSPYTLTTAPPPVSAPGQVAVSSQVLGPTGLSPVCTTRAGRVLRPRPPPVPGTHSMTLRPSTAPQRVPLPSPLASSLTDGPDPESDSLHAANPTVLHFLATAVTDPLFESSAASALVAELVDFAAACRLDFSTSLVAESAS
ncbi:unnamed protein product [Closterium sp. NIES-54]